MSRHFTASASAIALATVLGLGTISSSASAQIVQVTANDFKAGAGLITFSEYPQNTTNPTYDPSQYGGDANSPTVTFGGLFQGQTLSGNPSVDCPGAAATACVVGKPTASLALDPTSPATFITTDGANPTSPVLSGSPTFNGPVAILFSKDQAGVGFDGGFFDAVGSTGITAFTRDGTLIGTVVNSEEGIEFLGLVTADGVADIAGVFLDLVGAEPAGFAIDNVRFGLADEITIPGGGGTPPPVGTAQYWDGDAAGNANNGVVDGGNGTWNAIATNWTDPAGAANGAYSPNPGSVVFAGAPGVVTVDDSLGQISVSAMAFTVNGYTITGDSIALPGATTISVGDGTPNGSSYVATIDSVLTGAGSLTKTDLGTLVLNGVNLYTGGTVIQAGTVAGNAASFGTGEVAIGATGTLLIDQPTDAVFGNTISGAGFFEKVGAGTLALTSNSTDFTGTLGAFGGTTEVDGDFSNADVNVFGTLSGTGSVKSIAAQSGGVIAPGAGKGTIGTLTVIGNVNQMSGSTYAVDLTSAGASDLINAGSATIASGANLVATKLDSGRYPLDYRYTVLTAPGGVTGTYTLSGDTHVSLFYDLVTAYDPTHVYLDVAETSPFVSAAATPNEIAAAGAADTTALSGALHTAIGYLQTVPEAQAAFDAISGEIHATARAAAFEDSRFVREAIYAHLDSATDKALWMHGYGSWGHQRGDGNAARYDRDIYGFFLGYDAVNTGQLRIGLLGGYDHSTLRLPARASRYSADDISVGAYVALDSAGFALRAGGNYAFRKLHTHRDVEFTGFSDTETANYMIGIAQGFGEVGYKIPAGALTIEPFANAAFVHISNGRESEIGGPAALTIEKDGADTIFTNLGGRVSLEAGAFKLTGSGAWRHAGNSRDVTIPLEFSSGSSVFTIAAPPLAKDVAAVELSAEGKIGARTTISVGYSGQIGKGLEDHGGRATISYVF
jgi:fibronectin-binding autotransporter adhesin